MSFKDAIIYDMNYIIKEIDNIDSKELELIYKTTTKFLRDLGRELTFRTGFEEQY